MVDFSEALLNVSDHAAEQWLDRVGAPITVEEAKTVIAQGIRANGKLVMTHQHPRDGKTLYYMWNGLVFPVVADRRPRKTGEWVVKTTLLWGMAGGKREDNQQCRNSSQEVLIQ